MADETHCVVLILDKIVERLIADCQTDVPEDDVTRADVVKKGLLQDNRVRKNIEIAVEPGNHEDPNYIDGIVSLEELKNIALDVPPREIGGGELWWRRGVVRIEAFFIQEGLTEDEAFVAAYQVLGRVQNNIQLIDMTGVVDDWGERAIKILTYANTYFESGGAKQKQLIFRGKVFWACLTERP